MTPEEWNLALAKDVESHVCFPIVAREARNLLTSIGPPPAEGFKTAVLVEYLYPVLKMRGDSGIYARQRLFDSLMALAKKELADCCHKSPVGKRQYGRMMFPWVWHAPCGEVNDVARALAATLCPHCGQKMPQRHKEVA